MFAWAYLKRDEGEDRVAMMGREKIKEVGGGRACEDSRASVVKTSQ